MPKLYEQLGIILFFYSNAHEPIHAHAKKGEFESKATFCIENGVITEIKIINIKGRKPLANKELKDFEAFLAVYSEKIVEKWIAYFYITRKLNLKK